jgi:hypothetical protein
MGTRNRIVIGLSYRPARLHRQARFLPWSPFLGSINVQKYWALNLFKKRQCLVHASHMYCISHRVGRVLSVSPVVGIGTPHPFSSRRVCPPPHPFVRGEGTIACGDRGGGVPIPTRGHTLWCSIYISTLWYIPSKCQRAVFT